jgi:hypothetical protein
MACYLNGAKTQPVFLQLNDGCLMSFHGVKAGGKLPFSTSSSFWDGSVVRRASQRHMYSPYPKHSPIISVKKGLVGGR